MMRLLLAGAIAGALAIATPAAAFNIDFGAVLRGADGQVLNDGTPEKNELTLGRAAAIAMLGQYPDDASLPPDEKLRRGLLGLKTYEGKVLDLSSAEIELIKKYISKAYGPLVVARAAALLGDPGPPK